MMSFDIVSRGVAEMLVFAEKLRTKMQYNYTEVCGIS